MLLRRNILFGVLFAAIISATSLWMWSSRHSLQDIVRTQVDLGNRAPVSASSVGISATTRLPKTAATEVKNETIPTSSDRFVFERTYIDLNYGGNGKPGWVRAGDLDNDGDQDVIAGGGYALFIYENGGQSQSWQRHGNLDSTNEMGSNGAVLFDVDGDSDLDVVAAKYYSDLGWWENPSAPGGQLNDTPWTFHVIENTDWYVHDVIVADLDGDGKAEEFIFNLNSGYWDSPARLWIYSPPAIPGQAWQKWTIDNNNPGLHHGHAGLDAADIDRDGRIDVSFSTGWYEAPDSLAGEWTWHPLSDIYGVSNSLIRDIDGDKDLDIVISAGHHGEGVFWLENDGVPTTGSWALHPISALHGDPKQRHYYDASAGDHAHHPECLAVEDLDLDGDLDVVSCDLYFGEDPGEPEWSAEVHNVYVFQNNGDANHWTRSNIAPNGYPSHLLQLVDINQDGKTDIISESAGHSVISYYDNQTTLPTSPGFIYLPIVSLR